MNLENKVQEKFTQLAVVHPSIYWYVYIYIYIAAVLSPNEETFAPLFTLKRVYSNGDLDTCISYFPVLFACKLHDRLKSKLKLRAELETNAKIEKRRLEIGSSRGVHTIYMCCKSNANEIRCANCRCEFFVCKQTD